MALFQPSLITPDARGGLGNGVVDLSGSWSVSWQINGPDAMTGYTIEFYQNDAASTLLGIVTRTLETPVYGTTPEGERRRYTVPIENNFGMANGNTYKMVITQRWSGGSVRQYSASVFYGRKTPVLTINESGQTIPSSTFTFTGDCSLEQGEVLNWFRWRIASVDDLSNPIYDSGNIFGTMDIRTEYDGFFTGELYAVRLTAQTQGGVEADTGWVTFSVSYTTPQQSGSVVAECAPGTCAVRVSWTGYGAAASWELYRKGAAEVNLTHIANSGPGETVVYDYSARSRQGPYTYFVFPTGGSGGNLAAPSQSNAISPCYGYWTLLECGDEGGGLYTVYTEYQFRNNFASGPMSNNNRPSLETNFTQYPTFFRSPQNYRSGSLSSLIGVVDTDDNFRYVDTIALRDRLFRLSTTPNTLFLKSRKGDLARVRISEPISMSTADATVEQAQSISLSWVEVGSSDGISLTASQNVAAGLLSLISPNATVTPQTVTINVGYSVTLAVQRNGGGAISVTSGNPGIAAASVSGTAITVTGLHPGTARLSVGVAPTSVYDGQYVSVTVNVVNPVYTTDFVIYSGQIYSGMWPPEV